ncbi:helix-turn-helix transcriptional regulator [Tenggerimyces flavus]|uniref:Helix-turn-helix transcriptional regulator n=1 Tax=Tenggerimyces flavus TaxID=1708749 RepID=A0ABV7Y4K5_9ACTN|nr:helix-turn-helix transcriptional regulator [Tenggerimyces flavus]MBM7788233.1 transcriptional regulator with XRE-family HTH domain [Tenggerimyces flavus]
MEFAEVIRRRRAELGISQADLARSIGVDPRQVRRYEAGEQYPVLPVAVKMSEALDVSLAELAGLPAHDVDLAGDWYTAWQSWKDGRELVAVQLTRFEQQGELITVTATHRGRDVEAGGYLWRGELRLWSNDTLLGWYVATDGPVQAKGTLYFHLHQNGLSARGRWVGLSFDGPIVTGFSAFARTEDEARNVIAELQGGSR